MTTDAIPNDWLLKAGRIGAIAVRALLWLAMAAILLGFVFVFLGEAKEFVEFEAELSSEGIGVSGRVALGLIFGAVLILLGLAERLLQQLQRIIESVGAGDPFVPENADRLTRMAWLLIASQAVGFFMMTITVVQKISDEWDFSSDWSLQGLFAAVLLFILARVFRYGAAMREDLEGTV